MKSVECAFCHEGVMETRTKEINGQAVCIPCAARPSAPQKGN
jgi:formylmethanofuran dehydrogenase subunit E